MSDETSAIKGEEVEALVASSQKGDSDSFAKLYDLFIHPIYRYIYYRAGAGEAEDLTELVFLKTWENIRQYRSGQRNFSSWIFRIAHNVVIDFYRSCHRDEELSDQIQDFGREANTVERVHGRLTNEILGDALKELHDRYRQVIILKYINGFSNEEIGVILGRSQAALRILQFRALKKLRVLLTEKGFSEADL